MTETILYLTDASKLFHDKTVLHYKNLNSLWYGLEITKCLKLIKISWQNAM